MNDKPTPIVVFQSSVDSRGFRIIQNRAGCVTPHYMDFRLEVLSMDGMGGPRWSPDGIIPKWVEVLIAEYVELKKKVLPDQQDSSPDFKGICE